MQYLIEISSTVLIGVSSGVIVLYYPKLGLPDSPTFQLLESGHPFELYDTTYKFMFPFEKSFTVCILILYVSSLTLGGKIIN